MLDRVADENNLSDTPGNIFDVDEIGIKINNKPDSAITEKGSKNVHDLTTGEKSDNIIVIACCNSAGQFVPSVLRFKCVSKKQEFGESLPRVSDVYVKWKSPYITTEVFVQWFIQHFLKHELPGRLFYIQMAASLLQLPFSATESC